MTLRQIVRKGYGKAGAWQVTTSREGVRLLEHYGTPMLGWEEVGIDGHVEITGLGLGWGSVSDQQGVNKALEELGVDLYYSRKGGAHYVPLNHPDVPAYRRVA